VDGAGASELFDGFGPYRVSLKELKGKKKQLLITRFPQRKERCFKRTLNIFWGVGVGQSVIGVFSLFARGSWNLTCAEPNLREK